MINLKTTPATLVELTVSDNPEAERAFREFLFAQPGSVFSAGSKDGTTFTAHLGKHALGELEAMIDAHNSHEGGR